MERTDFSPIAPAPRLEYKNYMKRGPNPLCCPADQSRWRASRVAVLAAFSLIELLIVAALILVLTTMYWGSSAATRQRKQQTLCQNNLQKIYVAMQIYANDHAGKFPEVKAARTSEAALDVLVPRYTVGTESFICPGSKDAALPGGESLLTHKISYAYYMGRRATETAEVLLTDKQVDTQSKTAGQLIFSETGKARGNNHSKYGGNLLFCDGHVDLSPASVPFAIGLTQGVVLLNPKP